MIQNMRTFYFKSSKQCYIFLIFSIFYRKGDGVTPYSPKVALVMDYHKKGFKTSVLGGYGNCF